MKLEPSNTMSKIKIVSTPPGFAPQHIRDEWVGIEIPLPTKEQLSEDPPSGVSIGNENANGYNVLTSDAITALKNAEKQKSAIFWQRLGIGRYLRFSRNVCLEVS